MFEIVVVSANDSLHSFRVFDLSEALRLQYTYRMMGLAARIWEKGQQATVIESDGILARDAR